MAQFVLISEDTAPKSTTVTGTVTSYAGSRVIEGSGTTFLADFSGGDYVVNFTTNELRKIDFVVSNTEIVLVTAFGTAFAAATVKATKGDSRQISVAAEGANIPIIDVNDNTTAIVDGSSLTPAASNRHAVAPFIIQATTAASAYCTTTP